MIRGKWGKWGKWRKRGRSIFLIILEGMANGECIHRCLDWLMLTINHRLWSKDIVGSKILVTVVGQIVKIVIYFDHF